MLVTRQLMVAIDFHSIFSPAMEVNCNGEARRNPNANTSFNNNKQTNKREIQGKQRNSETGTQNKTQKQSYS